MPTISIARKHTLSHRKAKEVAEKIAKDLNRRFDLDYEWNGDAIEFERPGVSGTMHVGDDNLALDVRLGLLLTPLASSIEREIDAQLDKLLGAAATAAPREPARPHAAKKPEVRKSAAKTPKSPATRKPASGRKS